MTYYTLLGVSQNATKEEIMKAFHGRILQIHPDRNSDRQAEELTKELYEARRVLLNDWERHLYDKKITKETTESSQNKKEKTISAIKFSVNELINAQFPVLNEFAVHFFSANKDGINCPELAESWMGIYEYYQSNKEIVYQQGLHGLDITSSFREIIEALGTLSCKVTERIFAADFESSEKIFLSRRESKELEDIMSLFGLLKDKMSARQMFSEIDQLLAPYQKIETDEKWEKFICFLRALSEEKDNYFSQLDKEDRQRIAPVRSKIKSFDEYGRNEINSYLSIQEIEFAEQLSWENRTIYYLFDKNCFLDKAEISLGRKYFRKLNDDLKKVIAANIYSTKELLAQKIDLCDFNELTADELIKLLKMPSGAVADLYFANLSFKKLVNLEKYTQQDLLNSSELILAITNCWKIPIEKIMVLSMPKRATLCRAFKKSVSAVGAVMGIMDIETTAEPTDAQFLYHFKSLRKFTHFSPPMKNDSTDNNYETPKHRI